MIKRKTILISDNSTALLKHNTIILKKMGFYVVPVKEGLEILKTVPSVLPNLIILNVNLSGVDGIKILKYLKSNQSTSSIPVVMISGDDSAKTRKECNENGCDAFVEKPVKLRDIHDILQQFIYLPDGYSRKYLRVNVNCNVEVTKDDSTYRFESETLSEKGIYIKTEDPFPVSTKLRIGLPLYGSDSLQLEGRVIYVNKALGSGLSSGMAVEFMETDDDSMSLVQVYVQSLLNNPACDSIILPT
jgi:two-component system cell cycle response regulator DivK